MCLLTKLLESVLFRALINLIKDQTKMDVRTILVGMHPKNKCSE